MKNTIIYVVIALLVLVMAIFLFVEPSRKIDTHITLSRKDKIPYGTYTAFNALQTLFPYSKIKVNTVVPTDWEVINNKQDSQVLIIVNSYFNPSETDLDYLVGFAQKGNQVLISALQMNDIACKFFKVQQNNYYNNSYISFAGNEEATRKFDSLQVSLDSNTFTGNRFYSYSGIGYDNHFYTYDSSFAYTLGYDAHNKPNFLGMNAEKGSIYLHSAPIAFTNLFLLWHQNHGYLELILSLLPAKPKKIVWDEYFLNKKYVNDDDTDNSNSLLSVILKYENFRWAFWLAIAVVLFFIVTEAKRKQRLIPVYKKPANESLAFVTTVGKLYYEKGDHKNLAEKMTLFFLDYVRQQYKIDTRFINASFAEALAAKTNLPKEETMNIVDAIYNIQLTNTISSQQLVAYYQLLENFYKKA
ncbi:hypothetical protein [Parasediminibacterium sp. JCM 36343]|uniref:hypothetical protein n=1 Tax=Parasediminibacterium sp. JCM 36343 TaxID=3374279 RepID=UPI00397B69F8